MDNSALFIDPGLGGTGWAFYSQISVIFPEKHPLKAGVARPKSNAKTALPIRAKEILSNLCASLETEHDILLPNQVFIEYPEFWSDSLLSTTAASKGDLIKLTFLSGYLAQYFTRLGAEIVLLTPADWKGQMPKDVMKRRVRRATRRQYAEHAWDAVGMALSVQGVL